MDMDKQLIAARLKALREGAGLSQAKLARELKISQPLVARYETAVNVPSYSAMLAYADRFGVSCDYLMGRCEDPRGMNFVRKETATEGMQGSGMDGTMQEALEKCFEPDSPAYVKFKEAVLEVVAESRK